MNRRLLDEIASRVRVHLGRPMPDCEAIAREMIARADDDAVDLEDVPPADLASRTIRAALVHDHSLRAARLGLDRDQFGEGGGL